VTRSDPAAPALDPARALPDGAVVRLARRTRVTDDGIVLVGGAPTRVTRLKPAARTLIRDREIRVTDAASRALAAHLVEAGLADPDPATLPPADATDLTVVIPAYGRAPQLDRLLRSIRAELGDVRVVVVDDAAPPAEAAATRAVAQARGAELIVRPENGGPADARNTGLETVRTRFVLFMDTDSMLLPGAVDVLLRHFADPALALIAPRVEGLEDEEPNWVLRYESARSSLDHGDEGALVRPHSPMAWISTTTVIGRVEALGDGFTPTLRVAEDVDLVWRLVERGWRVRYEPRARVAHEHRRAVRTWLARKFLYGTGAATLTRRHGGLAAPAVLAPWTAGVLVALAAQRRWSLPVAAGISVVAAVRIARRIGGVRHPYALATRLTAYGVASAAAQGSALAVRHWWPAFAVASLFSLRARRIVVLSAAADAAVEYIRLRPKLDPLRFSLARRLDDLAYGAGVWWGAVKARSAAVLAPVVRSR
jgi:mycofactocin system glycosyltransferase